MQPGGAPGPGAKDGAPAPSVSVPLAGGEDGPCQDQAASGRRVHTQRAGSQPSGGCLGQSREGQGVRRGGGDPQPTVRGDASAQLPQTLSPVQPSRHPPPP